MLIGLILLKAILPAKSRTGTVATAQRFVAWTMCFHSIGGVGRAIIPPNAEVAISWLVLAPVWSVLAFLAGLTWSGLRSSLGRNTISGTQASRESDATLDPRKILEVRLARGEISIDQFSELLRVLASSGRGTESSPRLPPPPIAEPERKSVSFEIGDVSADGKSRRSDAIEQRANSREQERQTREEKMRVGLDIDRRLVAEKANKGASAKGKAVGASTTLSEMVEKMKAAQTASVWNSSER